MTESEEGGYVSITGPALVQPLVDLLAKLESLSPTVPNEVQTGQRENGYSMAIIILAALLFESALNRTAYIRNESIRGPDYFKTISSDQTLKDEIEEIYAARNLIAHNHVWEAKFSWDQDVMKFTE